MNERAFEPADVVPAEVLALVPPALVPPVLVPVGLVPAPLDVTGDPVLPEQPMVKSQRATPIRIRIMQTIIAYQGRYGNLRRRRKGSAASASESPRT